MSSGIIDGTRWTAFSQIGTQILRFLVSIYLARILSPSDFGLMAMAFIFISFIDTFKDLGTVSALIQIKRITDNLLSSLFYFNLLLGVVLWLLLSATAPVISRFFDSPKLTSILLVLGLSFVIHSIALVNKALLNRKMKFGLLAGIEFAVAVVNSISAITMAFYGLGVMALVGGSIAGSIASTILLWLLSSWKPKFHFKLSDIQMVFCFGMNLTASQIFSYFIFQADRLIIGRYLGESSLGFYSISQRIIMTPGLLITQTLNKVLFPAFSRIQSNNNLIRAKYLRACSGIASITFPLFTGSFILAHPFVISIFGSKWVAIIPLIKILSPIAILQSLTTTVGILYLIKGRTDLLLIWQIISGFSAVMGFVIGLHWGLEGVACGYAVVISLLTYPAFFIPFRFIDLKFQNLLTALFPYAASTVAMAVIVIGLKSLLELVEIEPLLLLILSVGTGIITYACAIMIIRPSAFFDFQKMFFLRELIHQKT